MNNLFSNLEIIYAKTLRAFEDNKLLTLREETRVELEAAHAKLLACSDCFRKIDDACTKVDNDARASLELVELLYPVRQRSATSGRQRTRLSLTEATATTSRVAHLAHLSLMLSANQFGWLCLGSLSKRDFENELQASYLIAEAKAKYTALMGVLKLNGGSSANTAKLVLEIVGLPWDCISALPQVMRLQLQFFERDFTSPLALQSLVSLADQIDALNSVLMPLSAYMGELARNATVCRLDLEAQLSAKGN